jgi:hypothetical protein
MPQYRTIAEFEATANPTKAELALIAKCKAGEPCTLGDGTRPETFTESRHISASLLRLLITGGSKDCGLTDDGVILIGAWITGELNLRFAKARGRTALNACHFTDRPDLTQAHLQQLSLQSSRLPGLFAQCTIVEGPVFLRSLHSSETVFFAGAQIGGQLDCDSAVLNSKSGDALNAQGLVTGQSLFLRNLHANGTVDLNGAQIGGQLGCEGSLLVGVLLGDGNYGCAFNGQGVKTGEDLFLSAISAKGTVDVAGAIIGGQLSFEFAQLDAMGGANGSDDCAIQAQGAEIGRDLVFSNVIAKGTIAIAGAKVGGNLSCEGANLDGKGGLALFAQRLRVAHGLIWYRVKIVNGEVNLNAAHVGDLVDQLSCWPTGNEQLNLDGFTYDRITAAATDANIRLGWLKNGTVNHGTFFPQPYTQLAKVLSDMGHDREARKVLLERETLLAKDQWAKDQTRYQALRNGGPAQRGDIGWQWLRMWSSKLWSSLIRRTAGYGYAPERALYWTLGFVGLGWLVYFIAWQLGAMVPNSAIILTSGDWADAMKINPITPAHEWTTLPTAAHYETFYALPYAADVFVPLVDLGQQSAWSQTTATWSGWATRLFTWALQIVGWVITALGAAAVTGIIKRDRG